MSAIKFILRFVGRVLFITLLLTSALLKIKTPSDYKDSVKTNYDSIRGMHQGMKFVMPQFQQYLQYLPTQTLIRIIGGCQALIALLLFFGDEIGGVLLLIYLIVYGLGTFAPLVKLAPTLLSKYFLQIAQFATLLGFAFVFMNKKIHKKAPIQA